ncbi:unnamed protein product [Toxocara canis]|uniref:HSL_N domain-containing protein n=1 Tax=Toxocara canis TaxID=6265 RepID=A0A183VG18_TOXCA|nr:unnamed protein product [Toxocara canis]
MSAVVMNASVSVHLFRLISKAAEKLKRDGRGDKAKALDTAAHAVLGLLKRVVRTISNRGRQREAKFGFGEEEATGMGSSSNLMKEMDAGSLIFEASSVLAQNGNNGKEYECFMRCTDVITMLVHEAAQRTRSPHGFGPAACVLTAERLRKVWKSEKNISIDNLPLLCQSSFREEAITVKLCLVHVSLLRKL